MSTGTPSGLMAPALLFLPGDRPVAIHQASNGFFLQDPSAPQQHCLTTGRFADAITRLIQQQQTSTTSHYLDILERQNHWLAGLAKATTAPEHASSIVTGDQLGILFIELTSQCNEQCIHCYAGSSPQCHDFLSLDEIKAALNEACQLGQPLVQLTGGDPLIHRDLVEAVAHAHALGFPGIEIYTNGLLLTDRLLEQLAPYRPSFAFSLYSHRPETHDAITQVSGSHARTLAAIRRTRDAGLSLRIGATQMPENAGHESELIELLEHHYGIDRADIRFEPIRKTGRGGFYDYTPPQEIQRSAHLPRATGTPATGKSDDEANTAPAIRKGKLCIAANGDIYPCIFARKTRLGNIRQQGLIASLQQLAMPQRSPSAERWKRCHEGLQCADCQLMAYLLGDA